MSDTTAPTTFDPAELRRSLEEQDAAAMADLYTEDATVEIADVRNTPSAPMRLEGREAIRAHFDDVCGRDMTHDVDLVAAGPDAIGYALRCSYPDGTRVLCTSVAELRDGRIAREVGVQAWDA